MASRSVHKDGDNKTPGQYGRTDINYDNLTVECILWPEEEVVKRVLSKASVAVKGSIVGKDEVDERSVQDMFRGGLNQALEWFTVAFECSGVTRGVTHQLVRTRKASFAQQSMRYADMGSFNARMPKAIAESEVDAVLSEYNYPHLYNLQWDEGMHRATTPQKVWLDAIAVSREAYAWLAEHDIPMQDARTVCPIATETYIICEYPLSEFIATYAYRACQMFYPETVALFGLMREALLEKCEWLEPHLLISCQKTSGGINGLPHKCTYQGWEQVEGQCTFDWALEENRIFKSSKVDK
jgi:thymidylate synthase ThyX